MIFHFDIVFLLTWLRHGENGLASGCTWIRYLSRNHKWSNLTGEAEFDGVRAKLDDKSVAALLANVEEIDQTLVLLRIQIEVSQHLLALIHLLID